MTVSHRLLLTDALKRRQGIVFYIVMIVVALMAVFVFTYHTFSRQVSYSAFYHINREKVRVLTEAILDSAFCDYQTETRNPDSRYFKITMEIMKGSVLNVADFDMTASLFEANKSGLLLGHTLEYTVKGRFFDRRTESSSGQKYYRGEGLATLEICVNATLFAGRKALASCQRRRHYDVKSVCLVSNENNRKDSYVMTFPLDYALLVRDGKREFRDGLLGESYNCGRRLEIADQSSINTSKRGLVYFGNGEKNDDDSRIFFNTSDLDDLSKAPVPTVDTTEIAISEDELKQIWPELSSYIIGQEKDRGTVVGYSGLKGRVLISTLPVYIAALGQDLSPLSKTTEGNTRLALAVQRDKYKLIPQPAGIFFAGAADQTYLASFLRGPVAQRYLYYTQLKLDASQMKITIEIDYPWPKDDETKTIDMPADGVRDMEAIEVQPYLSADSPILSETSNSGVATMKKFSDRGEALTKTKCPSTPIVSSLREDYLNYQGQKYSVSEKNEIYDNVQNFYDRSSKELTDITLTGQNGFRPFGHYALYTARYSTLQELIDSGLYDSANGVLNLRGVVSVEGEVIELNAPTGGTSITVRGRGALVAPNGFQINCGLKREDASKDLCVLFTRAGSINVNTTEKIEASLLAFNDSNSGSIKAAKNYLINGAVGVDRLYLKNNYSSGSVSKIEYDPRLHAVSDTEEIFTVTISPWIRMDDMTFGHE